MAKELRQGLDRLAAGVDPEAILVLELLELNKSVSQPRDRSSYKQKERADGRDEDDQASDAKEFHSPITMVGASLPE